MVRDLAENAAFQADMRTIIAIDGDTWNSISQRLKSNEGFLDGDAIQTLIGTLVSEDVRAVVCRTVTRLSWLLLSNENSAVAIAALATAIRKGLEDPTCDTRVDTVLELCSSAPGLHLHYKATELASATGKSLTDLRFICDIRPVYDVTRSKIKGALGICHLHLTFSDSESPAETVELRLTEADLIDLSDKIFAARGKLSTIQEFLNEKSVLQPKLDSDQ